MGKSLSPILEAVASALNALPGVFSTAQWGGRAYKLPGPGENRSKPKLLAHVYPCRDGESVGVSFKLKAERAQALVDDLAWISPHSFRTLARSGWIEAKIHTRAQVKVVAKLLVESRDLYPKSASTAESTVRSSAGAGEVSRRIARIMAESIQAGWKPPAEDDGFDRQKRAPTSRRRAGRSKRVTAR